MNRYIAFIGSHAIRMPPKAAVVAFFPVHWLYFRGDTECVSMHFKCLISACDRLLHVKAHIQKVFRQVPAIANHLTTQGNFCYTLSRTCGIDLYGTTSLPASTSSIS